MCYFIVKNIDKGGEKMNLIILTGSKIAENIGIYYNEERISALKETDDMEQAGKFFMRFEEAEQK